MMLHKGVTSSSEQGGEWCKGVEDRRPAQLFANNTYKRSPGSSVDISDMVTTGD